MMRYERPIRLLSTASAFASSLRINPRHQPIIYHPQLSPSTWPSKHTFPMSKFRETASYLTTFDDPTLQGPLVLSEEDFILPSKPDIKLLQSPLGPHSPSYVTRFLTSTLSKKESNSIGFRNGLYKLIIERTLIEVGATIRTCEEAKVYGLATNLGGGTHHAFEGRGR